MSGPNWLTCVSWYLPLAVSSVMDASARNA